MGPIWGRQDPAEPHVGPMKFVIWDGPINTISHTVRRWWWKISAMPGSLYTHNKHPIARLMGNYVVWILEWCRRCHDEIRLCEQQKCGRHSDRYMILSQQEPHISYSRVGYGVQDSKLHGVSMGPTWVPSAPDGPHVGPMNFAIRGVPIVRILHFTLLALKQATKCMVSNDRKR